VISGKIFAASVRTIVDTLAALRSAAILAAWFCLGCSGEGSRPSRLATAPSIPAPVVAATTADAMVDSEPPRPPGVLLRVTARGITFDGAIVCDTPVEPQGFPAPCHPGPELLLPPLVAALNAGQYARFVQFYGPFVPGKDTIDLQVDADVPMLAVTQVISSLANAGTYALMLSVGEGKRWHLIQMGGDDTSHMATFSFHRYQFLVRSSPGLILDGSCAVEAIWQSRSDFEKAAKAASSSEPVKSVWHAMSDLSTCAESVARAHPDRVVIYATGEAGTLTTPQLWTLLEAFDPTIPIGILPM